MKENNQPLILFTKRLLDLLFGLGILLTSAIPLIFLHVGNYIESFRRYYIAQTALYMFSGIFSLAILWDLHRMLATVLADNAFIDANAASLKRMSKSAFLIALTSLVRIFFSPTPATVVIILVFSIAGLFCLVLCQVFEKAIQYKKENDLTI